MVTERVLVQEATVVERFVPAVTQEIDGETVIVQESSVEYVEVPASYRTVESEVEIEPARIEFRFNPADPSSGPVAVDIANDPFSWDAIRARGGRVPDEFNPPVAPKQYKVKTEVFSGSPDADVSLKSVHDQIMDLAGEDGIDVRLFSHQGGFVILTAPERIHPDATPIIIDGDRIPIDQTIGSGLGDLIKRMFWPEEKRFRAISFTVSQQTNEPGANFGSGQDLIQLIDSGGHSDKVFEDYLGRYYMDANNFQVIVDVHEFKRVNEPKPAENIWQRYVKASEFLSLNLHSRGSKLIGKTWRPRG